MNFLSLPFLFPILVIAGPLAYPLYLGGSLVVGAIAAYFSKSLANLPPRPRVRAIAHAVKLIGTIRLKEYGRGIVRALKVSGAWAVTIAVFVGIAIPAGLVGSLIGTLKFLVHGYWEFAKGAIETSQKRWENATVDTLEYAVESVHW